MPTDFLCKHDTVFHCKRDIALSINHKDFFPLTSWHKSHAIRKKTNNDGYQCTHCIIEINAYAHSLML